MISTRNISKIFLKNYLNARTMKFQYFFLLSILTIFVCCNNATTSNDKSVNTTAPVPTVNGVQKSIDINAPAKSAASTDIYVKAAEETCTCLQPLITKVKQMVELQKENKAAEIKILADEIRIIEPQITACSENIRKKYGDMKTEEDKKRIFYALRDRCPDAVSIGAGLK